MDLIDLHTHSNCSDGSMTPTELVRHAAERGLRAVALSDHDTVAGIDEALEAGRKYGVEVVPVDELLAAVEQNIPHEFAQPNS